MIARQDAYIEKTGEHPMLGFFFGETDALVLEPVDLETLSDLLLETAYVPIGLCLAETCSAECVAPLLRSDS